MRAFFLIICVVALTLPGLLHAQWVQQTISLKPGWNAVFLEVDPDPQQCDVLFSGLPVESVWDFNRSVNSPQFVQDASTLLPNTAAWLCWFAPTHPLAPQSSLFSLRDGRPYLIKLATNSAPMDWIVTGKPSLRRTTWQEGGVNFVGFRVGAQGPTFQSLFLGEAGLTGQPIYTLSNNGTWGAITNVSSARPIAGQAYWVRCRLPAQRAGTILVDAGSRRGLTFDGAITEQILRIRNSTTTARTISVRLLPSATPPAGQPPLAGAVPLEYWKADYTNKTFGWTTLPSPLTQAGLPAGQEWTIRLGVRRYGTAAASSGSQFQGLVEVTDDLGTRWVVPVTADPNPANAAAPAGPAKSVGESSAASTDSPRAGLWVGEAVLNAVSQPANPGDATSPRPAGGEFAFRLIVHVDGSGVARLLQHIYLLRKPPVLIPDPEDPGFNIVDQPARTVAATEESLISGIVGPGPIVGRRITSAAFGFNEPVLLAGSTFGEGTFTGAVTLDYDDPLNPFKHGFHPDHNNLDDRFEQKLPEGKESFTVNRAVSLQFSTTDPLGVQRPGFGDVELGGIYRETITGLHRSAIRIQGSFRLLRVAPVPELNQ